MSFSDMRRHADRDAGQVDALVVADPARRPRPGSCTSVPVDVDDPSRTLPSSIRIRSPAATSPGSPSYVVERRRVSPGTSRVVIVNVVALLEVDRPVGERAEPDLRALQVDEDADGVPGLVGRLAHHPVDLLVVVVGCRGSG